MSSHVFAVGSLGWIPQRSQSKWWLAADPWYFCVSPAVGVSVWVWGLLHFRLACSECHKSLFSMCHLGTLEGVHGPCLWLGSSLPESLEQREEEPQGL